MISIKQKMMTIIKEQPDDSSYEEILRELAFARIIEKGIRDVQRKRFIGDQELKRRIKSWQK